MKGVKWSLRARYTPANKAGETFDGDVASSGNFTAFGSGAGGRSFFSRLYGAGGSFFGSLHAQDVTGSHIEAVITASAGVQGSAYFAFRHTGSFHASGSINGAAKNFLIDHPDPDKVLTHNLRHASIEAPELMVQYRGVATLAGGTATVDIDAACGMSPGTFAALATDAVGLPAPTKVIQVLVDDEGNEIVEGPPDGGPPPTPVLTRRQLRLGLLANGITTAQVEAVIAAIPDEITRETAQIEWADASKPCCQCAALLINAGVRSIIYGDGRTNMPDHKFEIAGIMCSEADVSLERSAG